jgi:hypothetical protein
VQSSTPPAFPTPYAQNGNRPVPPPPAAPARSYTPVIRNNSATQHPDPTNVAPQQ